MPMRPRPGGPRDRRRRRAADRREPLAGQARAGRDAAGAAAGAAGADGGRECEPTRLDEGDLAFRLAPRINAAGRLYRADAGVELLSDRGRGAGRARSPTELGRANSERRATEREVDTAAEAARRELPDDLREAPGAGPRRRGLAPRRGRDRRLAAGRAPPSAGRRRSRSTGRAAVAARAAASPASTCYAALEACSEHLVSFGGHRAAAGLSLRAENLEPSARRSPPTRPRCSGPRICGGPSGSTRWSAASASASIWPRSWAGWRRSGWAIPGVRLMVPSARVSDVRTMGEGKHARFSLHSGAHRALGVAFGRSSLGVGRRTRSTPRCGSRSTTGTARSSRASCCASSTRSRRRPRRRSRPLVRLRGREWWPRFEAELGASPRAAPAGRAKGAPSAGADGTRPRAGSADGDDRRAGLQRRRGARGLRGRLAPGGAGQRRHRLARFNGGAALIACQRCGAERSRPGGRAAAGWR